MRCGRRCRRRNFFDSKITLLMNYADKLNIKKEDLNVPALKTIEIVADAIKAINGELTLPFLLLDRRNGEQCESLQ